MMRMDMYKENSVHTASLHTGEYSQRFIIQTLDSRTVVRHFHLGFSTSSATFGGISMVISMIYTL